MDQLLLNPGFPLLSAMVFLPLVGSFILLPVKSDEQCRIVSLAATGLVALLSIALVIGFDNSTAAFQFGESYRWIPSLDINYTVGVDGISILLVVMTALIMPFCVLASWSYIKKRVKPFMICLLIMETAMIGVFVALDFVLFYILWEAMLIPMYLIIAIWGGPRKVYASIKFFYIPCGLHPSACGDYLAGWQNDFSFLHSRYDVAAVCTQRTDPDFSRIFPGLCHQGADVSLPHLAARRPC